MSTPSIYIAHCWYFSTTVSKRAMTKAWKRYILLAEYVFGEESFHNNLWYVYPFWQIFYVCNPYHFALYVALFFAWWPLKHVVFMYMKKSTPSFQMIGNINSINIRRGFNLQSGLVLKWGFYRLVFQANNSLEFLWRWFAFGPNKL